MARVRVVISQAIAGWLINAIRSKETEQLISIWQARSRLQHIVLKQLILQLTSTWLLRLLHQLGNFTLMASSACGNEGGLWNAPIAQIVKDWPYHNHSDSYLGSKVRRARAIMIALTGRHTLLPTIAVS